MEGTSVDSEPDQKIWWQVPHASGFYLIISLELDARTKCIRPPGFLMKRAS